MIKKQLLYLFFALSALAGCSSREEQGIVNMRDLGAYMVSDSLHVRHGLIFRSAHLSDASSEDLQLLASLPLTKVIDFRLEPEKQGRTDRLPEGSEYIALPIDATGNAAAQDAESKQASRKKFDIRKIIVMIAFNEQAQQVAKTMYHTLFFNSDCQAQYAQFFREVLATDSGAMLFHCSQGKDRTGVAAALLLAALGADKETIVTDFDATNAIYVDDIRKYTRRVRLFGGGEEEVAVVNAFIGVNTDNFVKELDEIVEQYGSMDNYLKGPIGLTDEDIKTLRDRYLKSAAL